MSVAVAVNPNAVPNSIDATKQEFVVDGTLTLSGSYTTGGDPMSLAGLVPSNSLPNRVEVYQAPAVGNAPLAFNFLYAFGTTQANGGLQVLTWATGSQVAGSGYDGALTAATANIRFRAWFTKFV